jgi:hypothetical protein
MIVDAYHGWGSDASIWDHIEAELGSGIELRRYDRGYFGMAHDVAIDDKPDVIITHSLGLMFVPKKALILAKKVIIMNGFSHFLSSDGGMMRRTRSMLALMKSNLEMDPSTQVRAFCSKAGMKEPDVSSDSINVAQLTADLDLLATDSVTLNQFDDTAIIHFVHAINDPIVNKSAIRDTMEEFPHSVHHHIEIDSHNLPDIKAGLVRKLIFDR